MPIYKSNYPNINNCGDCPFYKGGLMCPTYFGVRISRTSIPSQCEMKDGKIQEKS